MLAMFGAARLGERLGRDPVVEKIHDGGELDGFAGGALVNLPQDLADVNFRQGAFAALAGGALPASTNLQSFVTIPLLSGFE